MLLTSHTQSPLSSPTAAKVLGDRSCSRKSSRTQKQPFPTEHSSDEEDGSLGRDHARLTSPSETEASTEQGEQPSSDIRDDRVEHSPAEGSNSPLTDEMWLNSAPASQLERLNKATLVRLALGADISTGGMTKAQIIQSILSFRSSSFSRRVSTASARSCSADYTDESEDERTNYERGHEGGDEETEAERPAHDISKRRRRPTRGTVVGSANVRSPIRRTTRNSRDTRHSELTLGLPTDAVMTAASPMLNRLRKQRSLHFASPVRARTRARATARPVAPLPLQDFSPLKPRPRLAKAKATMQSQHDPHSTSDGVEKMDEDWVDDVSADPKRRNTRARGRVQRVAKIEASKSLVDPSDSEMDEDLDSSDALTASSETGSASEAAVDADLESDEESEEDADETATEVNSKSATPTGIDDYVDSDATDTPQGPKIRSGRKASPSSPSKIRRLRNGKLRLTPNGEIADNTDVEVESQLEARPLISLDGNHLRNRKKSNASSSGAKAPTKDDVATPKLSSGNDEARTAEPEHIDELNGLDLESLNLTDKEIPARQLSKTSKIGSGGFKDVFVGVWRVGKRRNKVAIADIREKLTEMDIKELGLLRDLKHENIVRFIGVSIPEDTHRTGIPCMIVSELCSNGDLWDYIRNVKPPSNLDIFRMLLETARGLEYLHMHSIVHRDVKSSNVLVTRNRSCKINDFGLARVKKSQRSKMHSVVGTVNWQAVELWCAMPQYNEKVDVWSTAMTFWEVLQWHEEYQSYPFEGMNEFMIYEEVGKKGLRPSLESIVPRYGEEIAKLLTKMWEADPRKRPTMDMVCADLEHLIETKKIELGA